MQWLAPQRFSWTPWLVLVAAAAQVCVPAVDAQAALPDLVKPPAGINLGSTSFYDGFGRTKPGITLLEYFRWTHNTEISGAGGAENPSFATPRIDAFPDLTQLIVATKWHPFGGAAGFSVLVPLVEVQSSFAADSPRQLPSSGFGLGDIIAGPTYQSKFFMGEGAARLGSAQPALAQSGLSRSGFSRSGLSRSGLSRSGLSRSGSAASGAASNPYFAYRVQFLVQIPSGKFDSTKSINPGSGYWAVAPYFAATYLPLSRLEISTRFHYQYNLVTDKLGNPPVIPHLVLSSGQAGQVLYDNLTSSYRFTRTLYMGVNAYGLYQLTPDKTNGVRVGGARETQFYVGPGGGYNFANGDTLNVNVYLKAEAHNVASGPSLQLLYIHRF